MGAATGSLTLTEEGAVATMTKIATLATEKTMVRARNRLSTVSVRRGRDREAGVGEMAHGERVPEEVSVWGNLMVRGTNFILEAGDDKKIKRCRLLEKYERIDRLPIRVLAELEEAVGITKNNQTGMGEDYIQGSSCQKRPRKDRTGHSHAAWG